MTTLTLPRCTRVFSLAAVVIYHRKALAKEWPVVGRERIDLKLLRDRLTQLTLLHMTRMDFSSPVASKRALA